MTSKEDCVRKYGDGSHKALFLLKEHVFCRFFALNYIEERVLREEGRGG